MIIMLPGRGKVVLAKRCRVNSQFGLTGVRDTLPSGLAGSTAHSWLVTWSDACGKSKLRAKSAQTLNYTFPVKLSASWRLFRSATFPTELNFGAVRVSVVVV